MISSDVQRRRNWKSSRYRCTSCRKTFNPLTGTPLAGLHHRDRWPDQAPALIAGETVAKAAERCKVAYTTAFRWRHRFLSALNLDKPPRLSGIVEADETFILEILQGQTPRSAESIAQAGRQGRQAGSVGGADPSHRRPRPHRRDHRCRPAAARRRQHHGRARAGHHPASGTVLRWGCGDHRLRSARPGQVPCLARTRHAEAGGARSLHINNVNAYHGRLKEWMRRFHGVATKNLPSYLSWRRTIEALSKNSVPDAWIMGAAGLGPNQQNST